MTTRILPALVATLLVTTGCLIKDTTETWYLGPAGSVTWVVTESDVRSDAQAAVDRQNEETTFRLAVERQDHPVARAFKALGFTDVRTAVLRRDAPFAVRTEARGLPIGELGLRILQRSGLMGNSTLARDGNTWVWNFTARDPHAPDVTAAVDEDVAALVNDLGQLKVVLIDGRFENASGFELSADRRVATIKDLDGRDVAPGGDDSVISLRLTWVGAPIAPTSSPSRLR
ncbi:MAG TPA: hypothetical protein VJN96_24430 [Vicinamibacterales bacterium]|nr:hypothetical protein [Vicinamibacterales bacterium]